jgi:hypothetical protein
MTKIVEFVLLVVDLHPAERKKARERVSESESGKFKERESESESGK